MSSEIDINKLRELQTATTQGEWKRNSNAVTCGERLLCTLTVFREGDEHIDNAAFIATAHNIWPTLLDELERLRDANEMLVGALKIASAECDQLRDSLRELIDANGPCSHNAARQKARGLIFGN